MPPDKKIRICVNTTKSDIEQEFNVEQPIHTVKQAAIVGQFDPSQKDKYHLKYQNEVLDESKKIEAYVGQFGWEDGVCLDLETLPAPI